MKKVIIFLHILSMGILFAQQKIFIAYKPNFSIDIYRVGNNQPLSSVGVINWSTQTVIYEIGKTSNSPTYKRAVYQWNISDLDIPNNSIIHKVEISFEHSGWPGYGTTINYFYSDENLENGNPNLQYLWNSTDRNNSQPIGEGSSIVINNKFAIVSTFLNGSEFVNKFSQSLNLNRRFTIGIAWKYESQNSNNISWFFYPGVFGEPSLKVWYTPPTVTIELDQRNSYNQRIGVLKLWEGNNWSDELQPGTIFNFEVNDNVTILGDQRTIGNEKYKHWERNNVTEKDNLNFKTFKIRNDDFSLLSRFWPTFNNTVIKNVLETSQISLGSVYFKDPWLIDYPDPEYGNSLRNRGMDAPFKKRTSPFNPNYDSSYNGDVYKGVFLNQVPDPNNPNKPYYSVKAEAVQFIDLPHTGRQHKFYFQNWSAIPETSATFQNANALETPVVFKQEGATVQANYKGSLLSN